MKKPKVAIVHDYFNQYGGGERVVEAMNEVWPQASVYTSLFDRNLMGGWLKIPPEKIKTNLVSKLPFSDYLQKHYFFAYPLAFRLQSVGRVDVVLSSSSYAAKFIKVPKNAIHICYLHTVPRFLWGYDTELAKYYHRPFDRFLSPLYRFFVPAIKKPIKYFDYQVAQKIDYFVANSKEVQKRIWEHYARESTLIYPPVDTSRFDLKKSRVGDYFLLISRLGGYKKVDLAVKAFNELGLPLKVVGLGPQFEYLRSIARPNVEMLGRIGDEQVTKLLLECKALIFPTYEDFGIVPVEAMAAGKPVLAFAKGGSIETVVAGKTGEFFEEQSADAIIKAVKNFYPEKYDKEDCRRQAEKFSKEAFKKNITRFVEEAYQNKTLL